jgi:hypothetical protein
MEKKALLIDINYKNTNHRTTNEVSIDNIGKILKEKFKYSELLFLKEDSNTEDNKPTKDNILNSLKNLNEESDKYSEIWIHYCGHSTVLVDERNEYCPRGIVPLDYEENGFIFDDELKKIFLSFKCKLFVFLDCCYGNYGFNIGHSMKVIEGKYIKEENTRFLTNNNDNTVYVISMYFGALKDKKSMERQEKCNLLSRRFAQTMEQYRYVATIDQFLMRMFKKLYDELYFLQTMVLSSNKLLYGRDFLFQNLGDSNRLNITYKLSRTEEEIKKEKEILNSARINQILQIIGKTEVNNVIAQPIPPSINPKYKQNIGVNKIIPQNTQNTQQNKKPQPTPQQTFTKSHKLDIPKPKIIQANEFQNNNINSDKNLNKQKEIEIGIGIGIGIEIKNKQKNKNLLNNIKRNHFKNKRKFKTIREML